MDSLQELPDYDQLCIFDPAVVLRPPIPSSVPRDGRPEVWRKHLLITLWAPGKGPLVAGAAVWGDEKSEDNR